MSSSSPYRDRGNVSRLVEPSLTKRVEDSRRPWRSPYKCRRLWKIMKHDRVIYSLVGISCNYLYIVGCSRIVKPEKNSIFLKKGKTVISVENRKISKSWMTK